MVAITAVYDANVLYPAQLRDLLMWLALGELVQAQWTDEIHEEWTRNLLENRPDIAPEKLSKTRALMEEALPDGTGSTSGSSICRTPATATCWPPLSKQEQASSSRST